MSETNKDNLFQEQYKILDTIISKFKDLSSVKDHFWLNYAQNQYERIEAWSSEYKKYSNWKNRMENKMHT